MLGGSILIYNGLKLHAILPVGYQIELFLLEVVDRKRRLIQSGPSNNVIRYFSKNEVITSGCDSGRESSSIGSWEKSQYERPTGRGHALETLISLERNDQFTSDHLNSKYDVTIQ